MISRSAYLISFLTLLFSSASLPGVDWPWFGGLHRDGVSAEAGLRTQWGDDEPRKLWKFEVGEGYSSVIEAEGLAYTVGNAGGKMPVPEPTEWA